MRNSVRIRSFLLALLCCVGGVFSGWGARAAELGPAVPGLQLWVRSDDLGTYQDGQAVDVWPDASGQGRHLTSTGAARPVLHAKGINGLASVRFAGDLTANPKVNQWFELPLSGEWAGITVIAVGTGLSGQGWFDSAPGGNGCLRTMGWVQLTGTKLNLARIPAPAGDPGVVTLEVGMDAHNAMSMDCSVNGQAPQEVSRDDAPLYGVLFRHAHIGNNNGSETAFHGELSELLIYKGRLSATARAATEHYLLVKYGLSAAAPGDIFVNPFQRKEIVPPPVKSQPVKDGLQLWARADDLHGLVDGEPVARVPDASGQGHDLSSEGASRPFYLPHAIAGRPALRFAGDTGAKTKVVNSFTLPLTGEWPEMTLLVAGRNLSGAGVFDSAPGGEGCLRTMGWLQLTGSKLAIGDPFPLLRNDAGAQIMAITLRKTANGGQTLLTYANGHLEATAESAVLRTVLLRDAHIGTNNQGETAFNGVIGELLLYNRALTDEELVLNTRYLAEKYAILLKSDAQIAREQSARSRWTLAMTQLPRSMSWFGNSYSGKDNMVVQSGFNAGAVLPDGTMVVMSIWDETHREGGFYRDGKALKMNLPGKGAGAVTTDGQYLYAAQAADDYVHVGIRRYTLEGKPAPWPGMSASDWIPFPCKKQFAQVRGLAVGNGILYVAPPEQDEVRAYDLASAQLLRSFPAPGLGRLACDRSGKLWIALADGVAQYTPEGTPTGEKIAGVHAGALALDAQGRLLVADDGARQQVIFYDLTGAQPREVATLGARGGVFAAPRRGAMGDDRLLNPNGVGTDAAGNVYVSGNGMLRGYTPEGKLRWQLECTQFCTCADFDPATDGEDIYTGAHHYLHVPGQPAGKDWHWQGYTADAQRFPELATGSGQGVQLRRLGGQLFRYTLGDTLAIHRQEAGSEIFIPCGFYNPSEFRNSWRPQAAPAQGRFFWCDGNGDGKISADEMSTPAAGSPPSHESFNLYVDERGGIWQPEDRWGVRYLPLQRINAAGVPIYDLRAEKWYARPAEFIQVQRAIYFAESDTMYLSGYTWEHASLGSESWGQCGREVICYDDWNKPTRHIRCRMPFPDGAVNIHALAIAPRAHLLFAAEMETSVLFAYDTQTGKLLGIIEPDAELVGNVGWIDIDTGIRAFTRKNGEVLLLVEDSYAEKQMVYRVPASINSKK